MAIVDVDEGFIAFDPKIRKYLGKPTQDFEKLEKKLRCQGFDVEDWY